MNAIEGAFRDVHLGEGIGIFEAWAIDCCVSDKQRKMARARDERVDWTKITDSELEEHSSSLCFMDPDGIRFALPAYMRFAIGNFDRSASLSVDAAIYSLEHGWAASPRAAESFTKEQLMVIAKFLRVMTIDVGNDWVDATAASNAYELFWNEYDVAA